jgi:hypothetical protein
MCPVAVDGNWVSEENIRQINAIKFLIRELYDVVEGKTVLIEIAAARIPPMWHSPLRNRHYNPTPHFQEARQSSGK